MIEFVDSLLNKVTMYRLILYYLILLVAIASVFGFFGILPFSLPDLLINLFVSIAAAYISNYLFSKIFKAATNIESVFITALILILIMPVKFPEDTAFIALAAVLAMASKYFFAINKRHIFNPAAFGATVMFFVSGQVASWWIGTPTMFPFVLIGGLLLLRKIRREKLVFNFLLAYLFIIAVGEIFRSGSLAFVISAWQLTIFNSALLFFMFVMLTEPLTSPATKNLQKYYGYVVALFYVTPQLRLIPFAITPELALCIGNVFTYIFSPNYRLDLPLKWKKQLSPDTFTFVFNKVQNFKFIPGQYMEWTLQHKNTDSRGNRRYFSISSSPTEKEIAITVKFYENSSSYKKKFLSLKEGEKIIAAKVAGDFVLPKNPKTPLAFIAGGIGITPFRSMIKYILDKNIKSNIVFIYSNRTANDILFSDIFQKAENYGVKTIYTLTDIDNIPKNWKGRAGYINEQMLKKEIPDYQNRIFYISGPQLMVQNFEKLLLGMKVKKRNIITDFFPGYAENK